MSALLISFGLCGDWHKIAIIDTENGSADLYAHLGPFQVLTLAPPFSPERYIEAINACVSSGIEVLIVDSISHEWEGKGGIIELSDQLGGQYQSAWKQLTPRHEKFKQAITQAPCHMITTTRRKQDYDMQKDSNGKTKVHKVGLKEVTREGWEYELTVNLELDQNHYAAASKDRTGLFMGKPSFIPDAATGKIIREWCETGVEAPTEQGELPGTTGTPVITLPSISDGQLSTVLDRVGKGESGVYDKALTSFSFTDDQRSRLDAAYNNRQTA